MIQSYIKKLLQIDIQVAISNEREKTLKNGTKVFCTTLKRTRPVLPGK
jgi:hypothetical protein